MMGNNELGSVKTQNLLLVGVIKGLAHMLTALIQVDHRVNLEVKESEFRIQGLRSKSHSRP